MSSQETPSPPNPFAATSAAPQAGSHVGHIPGEGDATGGMIPYKNPAALIAYYLGLFSLFPVLGFFLGVPAFCLGVKGLRDRSKRPEIKGSVHAWIGIVFGGGTSLIWGLAIVGIVIAAING